MADTVHDENDEELAAPPAAAAPPSGSGQLELTRTGASLAARASGLEAGESYRLVVTGPTGTDTSEATADAEGNLAIYGRADDEDGEYTAQLFDHEGTELISATA